MKQNTYNKLSVLALLTLFTFSAQAELKLERGSYVNRTHIDTFKGEVNLNFEYKGCDPNPSADKIKIKTDGLCRDNIGKNSNGDDTAIVGKVGEIQVSYDEPVKSCANGDQWSSKPLHINRSFVDLYKEFQKKGCYPSHIVVTNQNSSGKQQIKKSLKQPALCNLPPTTIRKKNFPTEDQQHFAFKANDKGFEIGKTRYWFNHDQNNWCAEYDNNKKCKDSNGAAISCCGDWASPLPLAYLDSGDKKIHLKGTVTLGPGPTASVRAIDKTYSSQAALFNDQKNGGLTQTDTSRGRIDFQTWRNEKNKLVRSILRSYETDETNAVHERSLNFFARNVFGEASSKSWCPEEHCFIEPPNTPVLNALNCKTASNSKACFNACGSSPSINMNYGANLNACSSCAGITPGECAIKSKSNGSEFGSIPILKGNITEGDNLSINSMTGEPRLKATGESGSIEAGVADLYAQFVKRPLNPGCHEGNAVSHPMMFEPEYIEPQRSLQSVPSEGL